VVNCDGEEGEPVERPEGLLYSNYLITRKMKHQGCVASLRLPALRLRTYKNRNIGTKNNHDKYDFYLAFLAADKKAVAEAGGLLTAPDRLRPDETWRANALCRQLTLLVRKMPRRSCQL
jgi:hypothetical protein